MKLSSRRSTALPRVAPCPPQSFNRYRRVPQGFPLRSFSINAEHFSTSPFRVAIIGSGPAGFYAARRLLSLLDDAVIDMYERLPTPFGLVRFGVAPDHPEVKVGRACHTLMDILAYGGHRIVKTRLPK